MVPNLFLQKILPPLLPLFLLKLLSLRLAAKHCHWIVPAMLLSKHRSSSPDQRPGYPSSSVSFSSVPSQHNSFRPSGIAYMVVSRRSGQARIELLALYRPHMPVPSWPLPQQQLLPLLTRQLLHNRPVGRPTVLRSDYRDGAKHRMPKSRD
jgi:hypothetical protein